MPQYAEPDFNTNLSIQAGLCFSFGIVENSWLNTKNKFNFSLNRHLIKIKQ